MVPTPFLANLPLYLQGMAQFGLVFVGKTTPIVPGAGLVQTDPTHWVLDLAVLGIPFREVKEAALFLTQPNVLPPDAALALYVSTTGGDGHTALPLQLFSSACRALAS